MKKTKVVIISLMLMVMIIGFAQAQMTGLEVMEEVYNRPTGPDIQSTLTMTLTNSRGSTRVREIKQFIKQFGEDEKKVMFFTAPSDVKNTSFMSWSYGDGQDDDMWIYLPALKKTKRISSSSKSDYFMGSDFTYDDLGERHPSLDTHKILREETVNGEDCYVVESISKDSDYFYARTITWVVKDEWFGMKREFYDEDDEFLKILTINEYKKVNGYWVIPEMEMYNEQKDHTTLMQLDDIKIGDGIKDSQFTERMMERGIR
ncbi:MAG: outer membrane lipoprotein-sorting protein [Spirochaetales bacterium]|nr:outer membrane lipoprotein-sorting protein [Spirochaetales bacterium]